MIFYQCIRQPYNCNIDYLEFTNNIIIRGGGSGGGGGGGGGGGMYD